MKNIAICILCVIPDKIWHDFLNTMADTYDIFVLYDNNNYILGNDFRNDCSRVNFIKIDEKTCRNSGYYNSNYIIPKNPSAWDKAIYYFCEICLDYTDVWLIEEDVFIPKPETIEKIDKKYPIADLLSAKNKGPSEDPKWLHWYIAKRSFAKPWYVSMVCAIRISKKLLSKIRDHVAKNRTLIFIEIMFNTLCAHNNLINLNPPELSTIRWRVNHKMTDITENNLYHPIKDINLHNKYRNILFNQ